MWLDLRGFHPMCWWGLTCYVDHVWTMQHAHISQIYHLPGLSADSALHYPTLPRGPPLATLAPKSIQLSEICELLMNQKLAKPLSRLEIQKPAKLLSQLEILEITLDFEKLQIFASYVYVWCPDQIPTSNSKIISKSKQKITSKFKLSFQHPISTTTNVIFVWCFLF